MAEGLKELDVVWLSDGRIGTIISTSFLVEIRSEDGDEPDFVDALAWTLEPAYGKRRPWWRTWFVVVRDFVAGVRSEFARKP